MEIKIAVASNIKFYKHTIPVILSSLKQAGISSQDIHIFNAGFDQYTTECVEGVTYHYLDHNSYEYSPLIEIVDKKIQSTYWLLIHDTCQVGPEFVKLLYQIPDSQPDKIALTTKPSMSIGVYKYDYLLSIQDKLYAIRNTDYTPEGLMEWKRWGVPNEDYILWMTDPTPAVYGSGEQCKVFNNDNWYGTGTVRRTEYFSSLDLYKNKSNWGQTGNNMELNV